ncbi:MAG: helix-turn-helix transcriptional regulator [Myxococcota bacterium]
MDDDALTVDTATLFGRCLVVVRRAARCSQAELAGLLRISPPALSQLEMGKTTPTFRLLFDMGETLRGRDVIENAGGLLTLMDDAARVLRDRGVSVVNRAVLPHETPMDHVAVDQVVARIYDASRPRFTIVPVTVLTVGRKGR